MFSGDITAKVDIQFFRIPCQQQGRGQDFYKGRGREGFQIGSNENGWSKILKLCMYKSLMFTLRKQKISQCLPLSEHVYHFLDIYVLMVIDVHQCQPRPSLA